MPGPHPSHSRTMKDLVFCSDEGAVSARTRHNLSFMYQCFTHLHFLSQPLFELCTTQVLRNTMCHGVAQQHRASSASTHARPPRDASPQSERSVIGRVIDGLQMEIGHCLGHQTFDRRVAQG